MDIETIYLETQDTVGEILTRIRQTPAQQITLVIPKRSVLLQGVLNLKLLKSRAELMEKKISIILDGGAGLNLVKEVGLPLVNPAPRPKPVTAKIPVEDPTIDEEVVAETEAPSPKRGFKRFKLPEVAIPSWQPQQQALPGFPQPKFRLPKPTFFPAAFIKSPKWSNLGLKFDRQHKIAALIVLFGLSVLATAAYFVVPKAYAALEVPSEPFSKQFSLILADQDDRKLAGPNIVPGRYIEVINEQVSTFPATGEKNRGATASGQITVINTTAAIQGLLANTRFQAANGLVFRTKAEILVPPARGRIPGRAAVDAVADEGGAKYNVASPLRLNIPGLGAAGEDVVYGEVSTTFTGGTDDIVKIVSEADVNKAKDEAAKNIFADAETKLRKQLKRDEEITSEFIQNDIIDALPSVSIGSARDQFEVRVQSRSWVLALPQDKIKRSLVSAASFEVPEGKQVTQRTIDNAKISVVESSFINHRIDLVVSLDGRIGPRLETKKIVSDLSSKRIDEARTYLGSISDITSSSVEIAPSFIKYVPLLQQNIKLQIIYNGE